MKRLPIVDPANRKQMMTEAERARQEKSREIAKLMKEQGLILDKQRIFDRWIIRFRKKSDMTPVHTLRGMNEDTLLGNMLAWLQKRAEKQEKKEKT